MEIKTFLDKQKLRKFTPLSLSSKKRFLSSRNHFYENARKLDGNSTSHKDMKLAGKGEHGSHFYTGSQPKGREATM